MPKKRKSLTTNQIEEIAQYQWANIKDIMDIGAVGRNKARDIFNLISDEYYKDKYVVHNGLVPMNMVLKYFNIDLKFINGGLNNVG